MGLKGWSREHPYGRTTYPWTMPTLTLDVDGMHCGGCASTVERLLADLPGVRSVEADHREARVRVEWDEGSDLRTRVEEALASSPYRLVEDAP